MSGIRRNDDGLVGATLVGAACGGALSGGSAWDGSACGSGDAAVSR